MKLWKILVLLILISVLLRSSIYHFCINYEEITEIPQVDLSNPNLINLLQQESKASELKTVDQILKLTNIITSKMLEFSSDVDTVDPNQMDANTKTHCVGYAALANSIFNYLSVESNSIYRSKHVRAKIKFFNFELTNRVSNPFFSNHDIIQISSADTNEYLNFDPSITDIFKLQLPRTDQGQVFQETY